MEFDELHPVLQEQINSEEWSENDDWTVDDWQQEVTNGDTILGYWEWVHHQIEPYLAELKTHGMWLEVAVLWHDFSWTLEKVRVPMTHPGLTYAQLNDKARAVVNVMEDFKNSVGCFLFNDRVDSQAYKYYRGT